MVLSAAVNLDDATPFGAVVHRILRPVLVCLALTLLLVVGRTVGTTLLQGSIDAHIALAEAVSVGHEAMLDQETGLRGWLLTGEPPALVPYEDGVARLERANGTAVHHLSRLDDPDLARAVMALWQAQQEWTLSWAAPVLAEDAAQLDNEGRSLFDAYRARHAALHDRLAARIVVLRHHDRLLFQVGLSLQMVLLLGSGASAFLQLRRLQRSVVRPLETLQGAVGRIEHGEYTTALPVEGPREVRALSESIAQMVVALRRGEMEREHREAELRDQAALNVQVLDLAHDFTARLDVPHVLEALVTGFAELSRAARVVVWLIEDAGMVVARHSGTAPERSARALGDGLAGRAAVHGVSFAQVDGAVRRPDGTESAVDGLAIPLVGGGRTQGVVELHAGAERVLVLGQRLAALKTLAAQGGMALAAAQLHHRTVELGRTDPLTGIRNRRTLEEDLTAEVALSVRHGRPLSAAIVDIDHFKQVNDEHGHLVGDDALREVAQLLAAGLRESDAAYRSGGEEFVMLLRDTDAFGAMEAAERLRLAVAAAFTGRTPSLTVSVGVAELEPSMHRPDALLAAADSALYAAKAGGRNRAILAPSASESEISLAGRGTGR